MRSHRSVVTLLFVVIGAIGLMLFPVAAYAHCDGVDGPVVKAAQEALASGDVNLVLIWVQKSDEAEMRRAFAHAEAVRKLGPQARELADAYFFETLVRIHRAGEGAPYTGLKPAGRDLGPAIPAADQALKSGDVAPLTSLLDGTMRAGLQDRFRKVMAARSFKTADLDAGRGYVAAYVTYVHYVEKLYETALGPASGHDVEAAPAPHEH